MDDADRADGWDSGVAGAIARTAELGEVVAEMPGESGPARESVGLVVEAPGHPQGPATAATAPRRVEPLLPQVGLCDVRCPASRGKLTGRAHRLVGRVPSIGGAKVLLEAGD